MRYTVYKTTNTHNGRYYIGVHATVVPNDKYLGSGKALREAIRKYGRASFTKEVLFEFSTPEEMYQKERELVTTKVKRDPLSYNLIEGGECPARHFSSLDLKAISQKGNDRIRDLLATNPSFKEKTIQKCRAAARARVAAGPSQPFLGRKHTEATKEKMRGSKKGQGAGVENSQFGTHWLSREGERPIKVRREQVAAYLSEGWCRGRKITAS